MKPVIVIVGPTGVGKTKMGVALAKAMNGEVISGDSMQIYRGMDIGTAKVTESEMEGIVHHLIDIKDPKESYSVKDFQTIVRSLMQDVHARNKVPIIVGGTGLYIKAALYDYEFEETSTNHEIYQQRFITYDNEQLYAYLKNIDEVSAQELHPNNRQRVLRAIEIFETTGIKKSDIIAKQQHTCLYNATFIGLTMERELLYERINQRVDIMITEGLEQEVRSLYRKGYTADLQSMKAIGYKEWVAYFNNLQTKEETIALIKKNSRNYAKRQYTWFKNQVPVTWFSVSLKYFEKTIQMVLEAIKD
jgi:tRNA dimethylallyltransferase